MERTGRPISLAADVRAMDDALIHEVGIPPGVLLEHAGHALADALVVWWGDRAPPRTLVLCGPGNNGGDGYALAGGSGDVLAGLCGRSSRTWPPTARAEPSPVISSTRWRSRGRGSTKRPRAGWRSGPRPRRSQTAFRRCGRGEGLEPPPKHHVPHARSAVRWVAADQQVVAAIPVEVTGAAHRRSHSA